MARDQSATHVATINVPATVKKGILFCVGSGMAGSQYTNVPYIGDDSAGVIKNEQIGSFHRLSSNSSGSVPQSVSIFNVELSENAKIIVRASNTQGNATGLSATFIY